MFIICWGLYKESEFVKKLSPIYKLLFKICLFTGFGPIFLISITSIKGLSDNQIEFGLKLNEILEKYLETIPSAYI